MSSGKIGNFFYSIFFQTSCHMRTVTNFFIANLTFADIITGILAIPCQFQAALLRLWDLSHFLCKFCQFIQVAKISYLAFHKVAKHDLQSIRIFVTGFECIYVVRNRCWQISGCHVPTIAKVILTNRRMADSRTSFRIRLQVSFNFVFSQSSEFSWT